MYADHRRSPPPNHHSSRELFCDNTINLHVKKIKYGDIYDNMYITIYGDLPIKRARRSRWTHHAVSMSQPRHRAGLALSSAFKAHFPPLNPIQPIQTLTPVTPSLPIRTHSHPFPKQQPAFGQQPSGWPGPMRRTQRITPSTMIDAAVYYETYNGHRVDQLAVVHDSLRLPHRQVIWLAGDSSLDNK